MLGPLLLRSLGPEQGTKEDPVLARRGQQLGLRRRYHAHHGPQRARALHLAPVGQGEDVQQVRGLGHSAGKEAAQPAGAAQLKLVPRGGEPALIHLHDQLRGGGIGGVRPHLLGSQGRGHRGGPTGVDPDLRGEQLLASLEWNGEMLGR